jgi:O-antigen/teichoic acid export membrane protein
MRPLHFTIAKNAVANIMRGGASAVVAVVLPHFLTRVLGTDRFAGWALMLQLVAYANYLDFGLQTAVARYLAAALEKGDHELRDRLLSNAIAIPSVAGVIAICSLGIVAWQLPHLFRSIPLGLSGEIGSGILILGVSTAIGLPLSAYTGVLIGMQRNEFPAIAIAGSRLLGAAGVILVAHCTHSLAWLALCIAISNLAGGFVQYAIAKKLLSGLGFSFGSLDRGMTAELVRYCSTLSVWSVAMLLVSGLDVTIVGLFNFNAVGAYSIASTLIMIFTGLIGAAFSAMLAPVAVMQARQEYLRISRLVLVATRLSSYLSIGMIVVIFLFGEALIRAWVGPAYLAATLPVLKVLLVAQAIRQVGSAYGAVLVAMGLQRYGLTPVLIEGVSNLLLSVLGMILIGPAGVAWATLIAASIALVITIFFVMRRVHEFRLERSTFIRQGILVPLLPFLPLCICLLCRGWFARVTQATGLFATLPMIVMMLLTVLLVIRGVTGARRLKT